MPTHTIDPVFDSRSRILILGSFPSVKSREACFFYGHPRNRFWPMMAALLRADIPVTVEEKKRLLLNHGIALWDVIASCEINGSSDASITDITPNDLTPILNAAPVERVICNGTTAFALYKRYCLPGIPLPYSKAPSTSPANAAYTLPRLIAEWRPLLCK